MRDRAVQAAYVRYRSAGDFSMRDVAGELGVSAPALYHHFEGKQQLLDTVADRAFAVFGSRLKATEVSEPADVIRATLHGYRDFARDEPNLFTLLFVSSRPGARRFPRDFANHRSAVFNALWKATGDCLVAAGGERDDALYLAHDLWALTHGQILLWRAGRFEDDETFERVLTRSVDHFIGMLSRAGS